MGRFGTGEYPRFVCGYRGTTTVQESPGGRRVESFNVLQGDGSYVFTCANDADAAVISAYVAVQVARHARWLADKARQGWTADELAAARMPVQVVRVDYVAWYRGVYESDPADCSRCGEPMGARHHHAAITGQSPAGGYTFAVASVCDACEAARVAGAWWINARGIGELEAKAG